MGFLQDLQTILQDFIYDSKKNWIASLKQQATYWQYYKYNVNFKTIPDHFIKNS